MRPKLGMLWCAIILAAGPVQAQEDAEMPAAPAILEVTGEGAVASVPDMAVIRLGVEARAPSAAEAVSALSSDLGNVIETLAEAGIVPRDIQTGQLRLSPVYDEASDTGPERRTPEIAGYTAESIVSARVRELDALGDVLSDAVNQGANRFEGLDFTMSNPQPAEDAALAAAVADAMRKGALMAEAAGLALGPIRSISEAGGGRAPRPVMDARMAMSESVPIAGGEIELSAQATIRFDLVGN